MLLLRREERGFFLSSVQVERRVRSPQVIGVHGEVVAVLLSLRCEVSYPHINKCPPQLTTRASPPLQHDAFHPQTGGTHIPPHASPASLFSFPYPFITGLDFSECQYICKVEADGLHHQMSPRFPVFLGRIICALVGERIISSDFTP